MVIMPSKTQEEMFYEEHRKIAVVNEFMMDLIRNNEITNAQLATLIKKRPTMYGRFAGFVGKLKE